MNHGLNALEKNKTWSITDFPKGKIEPFVVNGYIESNTLEMTVLTSTRLGL